jgi:uridine phosphorylase
MKPLDKASYTLGKPQYHVRLSPGDVGKYVLLPGDPDRVLRIAKHLDDAQEIAFHREHRTVTGTYKGITVSATSTGMGCPSTAIAVEELANIGATHFIRVGSTGALREDIELGDLIISTGSMRNEGTTRFYVREAFPAVPDHYLTHALIESSHALVEDRADLTVHVGLNSTDDAFYGETPEHIQMLVDHKLLNVEMESAAIYVIAAQRGLRAAMISAVSGNLVTGEVVFQGVNEPLVQGWEDAIAVSLEAIVRYESEGYEALC